MFFIAFVFNERLHNYCLIGLYIFLWATGSIYNYGPPCILLCRVILFLDHPAQKCLVIIPFFVFLFSRWKWRKNCAFPPKDASPFCSHTTKTSIEIVKIFILILILVQILIPILILIQSLMLILILIPIILTLTQILIHIKISIQILILLIMSFPPPPPTSYWSFVIPGSFSTL